MPNKHYHYTRKTRPKIPNEFFMFGCGHSGILPAQYGQGNKVAYWRTNTKCKNGGNWTCAKCNIKQVGDWQKCHPEKGRERTKRRRLLNPSLFLFLAAKHRAKVKRINFNIGVGDIIIPKICPVLGIKIYPSTHKIAAHSPSLDRIDNRLGYIKGNVRVISFRANSLKSDATKEELFLVLKDLRKISKKASERIYF